MEEVKGNYKRAQWPKPGTSEQEMLQIRSHTILACSGSKAEIGFGKISFALEYITYSLRLTNLPRFPHATSTVFLVYKQNNAWLSFGSAAVHVTPPFLLCFHIRRFTVK